MDVDITPIHRTVAENLATRRRQLGLSQAALAKQLGIAAPTIAQFETLVRVPNLAMLERLAAPLKAQASEFLVPNRFAKEAAA